MNFSKNWTIRNMIGVMPRPAEFFNKIICYQYSGHTATISAGLSRNFIHSLLFASMLPGA